MHLEHNGKRRTEACIVFESATLRVKLRCWTCANSLGQRPPARKVIDCQGTVDTALDLVRMAAVEVPDLVEKEAALLGPEAQPDLEFVASRYANSFPTTTAQPPSK
jgi:hypothetical protein